MHAAVLPCCSGTDAGEYVYLGCFEDSATTRDVTGPQATLAAVTVDKCATQCRSSGYPYAALQMGTMCFCGSSYGSLGPSIRKSAYAYAKIFGSLSLFRSGFSTAN